MTTIIGIRNILPSPQHTPFVPTYGEPETTVALASDAPLYPNPDRILELNQYVPPYGKRQGWVPRRVEDFGDGGSFPEVHVAQYPLEMGRKTTENNQIVPLTTDGEGLVNYDAIVKQGHRRNVHVFTKPSDMKDKDFGEDELARPDETHEAEVAEKTKKLLEEKMHKKMSSKALTAAATATAKAKYIRYTPANPNPAFNSGANHRIIRMVEMPIDPLEPPKFRHTKVPRGPSSPPVPVMHSPPRKLSKEERDSWRIPPCISNWKNNKGYVIPLDKRLAADGRGLQEPTINDTFAKLSEALYIAERNAREEVARRNAVRHRAELQRQEEREEELKNIAKEARIQRTSLQKIAALEETEEEREERIKRDEIREQRIRDREREHRLEQRAGANKKTKAIRDGGRDIAEKIALGQVVPKSEEAVFDQRLFNQTQGLDSGFGDDEDYNIYDKRLFGGDRERALYKAPKKEELEVYGEGANTNINDILKTSRFKPTKDFTGIERNEQVERDGPVQFERDKELEEKEEQEDNLGLDAFFHEVRQKTGEKRQTLGVMHAVGGGSEDAAEYSKKSDRNIGFVSASNPDSNESVKEKQRDTGRESEKRRETERPRAADREKSGPPVERERNDRDRGDRDKGDRDRGDRGDRDRGDRERGNRGRGDRGRGDRDDDRSRYDNRVRDDNRDRKDKGRDDRDRERDERDRKRSRK